MPTPEAADSAQRFDGQSTDRHRVLALATTLGMGMAVGMCPICHAATCSSAVGVCAAIIGLMVLVTIGHLGIIRRHASAAPLLLIVTSLERPPQRSSF